MSTQQSYMEAREILRDNYRDTNFCTVVALATAFNWSAGKAHRHMAKHGRPHRRGPAWSDFRKAVEAAAEKAGREVQFLGAYDGMTINRFCKERHTGTYIIAVKGHTLTVIDGVMQDWTADTAGRRKIAYRSGFNNSEYEGAYGVARII